jgi:hypothetical protein
MTNAISKTFPDAMAWLNYARQFYKGAEIIYSSKPQLTEVVYALYFHAVESLLKAYLKANGIERWGHDLGGICIEAQNLGLQIDRDKSGGHDLRNVSALLGSDKGDAGFRYFTWESRSKPDLAWTRDVVAELLNAVAPAVESTWDKTKSGVPVKMDIVIRTTG